MLEIQKPFFLLCKVLLVVCAVKSLGKEGWKLSWRVWKVQNDG
jgi:hypothetical protein